jgi:H+/Cl- antiporter ClcA
VSESDRSHRRFPAVYRTLRDLLRWDWKEHRILLMSLLKWTLLGSIVGAMAGAASAFFLWGLDRVTQTRESHPWLLLLLPVGGVGVGWLYTRYGHLAGRGNNLILDQLHGAGERVPIRMAPMVLLGTLVTHLLGGSAGREGTAVQMGGSMADWFARQIRLKPDDRRLLLMGGMAGGFSAVFGTPLAGTIFGVEVVRIGNVRYDGLVPCLIAALIGNGVADALGVHHTHYPFSGIPGFSPVLFLKVAAAGLAFGVAALFFSELAHFMKGAYGAFVPSQLWRPSVGGLLVIALVYIVGTRDYIGLGVPMIKAAFTGPVSPFAFFWKTVFTAVTLGAGFQGGEVTPLFFVGATLGNLMGRLLAEPAAFMAGLGFVSVFAGAANTPLTCIVMGVELFGHEALPYIGLACIFAYVFSGHRGIYTAQRVGIPKSKSLLVPENASLSTIQHRRRPILPDVETGRSRGDT